MPDAPDPDATGAYRPEPPPAPADRFAPGAVLSGRYRVVALLGRGGMGEVYRADDLTLGQPVALKFLPAQLASDPDRLARFRKEVAAARKVSHPNVCRVYDIAEHEAQPFLTMEYIDGEDLASVVTRLGRVPEEKGVELARQLCSALAAVHDQGLLHRDLKPANVMLDGRGRVRLTDFGLAATAGDLSATEVRSGTPLYQAPEQLGGQEVTVRSDVYALGLVLYEVFTGRRAYPDSRRGVPPPRPSSHVTNLDPAVERVLLQCLEASPADRPRSAAEVLAGLPGGDPLAAAVAAGETPSPQLVADAGEAGLVKPWVGLLLVAVVVGGLGGLAALNARGTFFPPVRLVEPPAEQERTARQLLARYGLTSAPADTTSGYYYQMDVLTRVRTRDPAPDRFAYLATGRTHSTAFLYRRSPVPYRSSEFGYVRTLPPADTPGEAVVWLDGRGRLLRLLVVPEREAEGVAAAPDWWTPLLDDARFEPGDTVSEDPRPRWTPPVYCDERKAWDVRSADGYPFHAEAGAFHGRAVYFEISDVRERPPAMPDPTPTNWWASAIGPIMLVSAGVLALRNVRRARADYRGAIVTGGVIGTTTLLAWILGGHHHLNMRHELPTLTQSLGLACLGVLMFGVIYLAFEPIIRRRWPWRLTAWTRITSGRLSDPLVGRDILVGVAAAVATVTLRSLSHAATQTLGLPWDEPMAAGDFSMSTTALFPGAGWTLVANIAHWTAMAFNLFLFTFLVGLLVRKEWLVWLLFMLIWVMSRQAANGFDLATAVLTGGLNVVLIARFGLLAICVSNVSAALLVRAPTVADVAVWHFWQGALVAGLLLALAVWGAYAATGGRRLFRDGFFGDD